MGQRRAHAELEYAGAHLRLLHSRRAPLHRVHPGTGGHRLHRHAERCRRGDGAAHLAERRRWAGISTATVRYYERIGVLPAADRSPNGYRNYDERTVERLGFIGRAKQLGCTLDEIGDLVTAWDGGQCGPVQDRLRDLVDDKLAASQTEIVALATLTDDLRRAAATLETHRPEGRCDELCGCLPQTPTAAPITPTTEPGNPSADNLPIACSLDLDQARQRVEEWNRLLHDQPGIAGSVTSRQPIDGGIEFDDTVDLAALVNLATAEHDCCPFFGFAVTIDHRGIGFDITAPRDAQTVVTSLFGAIQ